MLSETYGALKGHSEWTKIRWEEKLYVNAFVFPPRIVAFACSSFLFARKSFVPLRNFAIKIGGVEGKTINAF